MNHLVNNVCFLFFFIFLVWIPDWWLKLNLSPVCFGAQGDQFGNFTAPAGRLAAIKLVWRNGYVSCYTSVTSYWSYWGCNDNPVTGPRVNVVITNLSNHILLPPNQLIDDVTSHWYKNPGYNSLSPELVLSVFLNPISVPSNQVLRLWYGEDLSDESERGRQRGKSLHWCLFYLRLKEFNKML